MNDLHNSLPHDGQQPSDEHRLVRTRAVLQQLRIVFRSIQAHSRWVEKQCGVSGAQLWALWEVFDSPGVRVSDLSRMMSIHQSTASNMLDKLEAKRLLRRERGGPDQRVVRLYLTEQGKQLLTNAPRPAQGAIYHALQQLPDDGLEQLQDSLDQLVRLMDFKDGEARMRPMSEPGD
jgi:DNA-binding MarR family transcriptional regulator